MSEQQPSSPRQIIVSTRLAAWTVVAAIAIGVLIGRAALGGPTSAVAVEPDATATRAAELAELDLLRTQVAAPVVCTPAPTATPTETPAPSPTPTQVPAVGLGESVSYADNWTVTVTGFSIAPQVEDQARGKFVQANVTLVNDDVEARRFRFDRWRLVDARGRVFELSRGPSNDLSPTNTQLKLDPSLPYDFVVVFDVAVDAGPAFVIESESDPTFRVAVEVQQFG